MVTPVSLGNGSTSLTASIQKNSEDVAHIAQNIATSSTTPEVATPTGDPVYSMSRGYSSAGAEARFSKGGDMDLTSNIVKLNLSATSYDASLNALKTMNDTEDNAIKELIDTDSA